MRGMSLEGEENDPFLQPEENFTPSNQDMITTTDETDPEFLEIKIEESTGQADEVIGKINSQFQKRPLKFDQKAKPKNVISREDVHEFEQINSKINQLASKILYGWKDVPVIFPESITGLANSNKKGDDLKIMKDLFILPTFNELDEIALGPNGKNKRLSSDQLKSIKRDGKFEVDSIHFPGMKHKWVLANWLQEGYINSNETFYKTLSKSLYLLIFTARGRFTDKYFSIVASLRSIKKGFIDLFDLMFGLREMKTVPFHDNLEEDFYRYIVSDLTVEPSDKEKFDTLCLNLRKAFDSAYKVKFPSCPLPHFYRTNNGLLIDVRLYDPEIREAMDPILTELLQLTQSERAFLNKLKVESVLLFKGEGLNDSEIVIKTQKILAKEYFKIVESKLLTNTKLEAISSGLGALLVSQAKTVITMEEVADELKQQLNAQVEKYTADLKAKNKIRSRIYKWVSQHVEAEKKKFHKLNELALHQKSIERLNEQNMPQAAYLAQKEMQFIQSELSPLIKKYENIKEPCREFVFHRKIWFPKNYKVIENRGHYSLKRTVDYKNSTKRPFWRWTNFFIRTWVNFCNSILTFGLIIPFVSPVSFRALFSIHPYYPDVQVDRNGKLVPTTYKVKTFVSRLTSIWSSVRRSREKFESIPDKGLIGKNVSRVFNVIWNYFFKGFVGSVGLAVIFPIICVGLSTGSLFISLLTPLWLPLLSVIQHIAFILIFDWDYPFYNTGRRFRLFRLLQVFIGRFFLLGACQPVAALATATLVCPAASLIVLTFALLRRSARKLWDSCMYYSILKCQAKVPSHDSFVARRIAGPGLAANYFYQIKPEQALAALEAHMEIKILDAYLAFVENILNEPLELYKEFFDSIFENFSYRIDSSCGSYLALNESVSKFLKKYNIEATKRRNKLTNSLNTSEKSKIRLAENDLKALIVESTKMVQKHYEQSILKYSKKTVKQLFEQFQIDEEGDWTTLAGCVLEEIFDQGILTPLEATDCIFNLQVEHLNLGKYSSMIAKSEPRDDLDLAHVNYNPRNSRIVVDIPAWEKNMFDPNFERNFDFRALENREKVLNRGATIPPKIPRHPAMIAAVLNNLGSEDNKINYESLYNVETKYNENRRRQLSDLV